LQTLKVFEPDFKNVFFLHIQNNSIWVLLLLKEDKEEGVLIKIILWLQNMQGIDAMIMHKRKKNK
jgi:hypothetical protein